MISSHSIALIQEEIYASRILGYLLSHESETKLCDFHPLDMAGHIA